MVTVKSLQNVTQFVTMQCQTATLYVYIYHSCLRMSHFYWLKLQTP